MSSLPKGMPPYPKRASDLKYYDLILKKKDLLSQMLWMETSLTRGYFGHFADLVKAREELKKINEKLNEIND